MEASRLRRAPARRAAQGARPLDKASLRGRPSEGTSREEWAPKRVAASGAFQKTVEDVQSFTETLSELYETSDLEKIVGTLGALAGDHLPRLGILLERRRQQWVRIR